MLLAIDTSTHYGSVAVADGDRLLAERTWLAGQNHTRTLLPHIQGVLNDAGIAKRQIDAIAVALGPGSFNGLRAGLGTAKGLALSLGVPVVGVPTLEILAVEYGLSVATMNAGRGRVYTWRPGSSASQIDIVEGSSADRARHAGTLARLAGVRLAAGQTDDLIRLEPIYVQPPQIHPKALGQATLAAAS